MRRANSMHSFFGDSRQTTPVGHKMKEGVCYLAGAARGDRCGRISFSSPTSAIDSAMHVSNVPDVLQIEVPSTRHKNLQSELSVSYNGRNWRMSLFPHTRSFHDQHRMLAPRDL